jgi:hypothetical protein
MDRRAFRWLLAILASVVLLFAGSNMVVIAEKADSGTDEKVKAWVLSVTVQIRMFAPTSTKSQYVMALGLGTLIRYDDRIQIVTHNHWGEILKNVEFVRFHDASDQLLLEIDGNEFKELILMQDAGTMLFNAPLEIEAGLRGMQLASLGSSDELISGDKVLLVHQKDGVTGTVIVLEAMVDSHTTYKQLPAIKLHTLDGQPIVSGDSGGGMWLNGKLVGNMWGRETVEKTEGWRPMSWFGPDLTVKEVCYVAKLPFDLGVGEH